MTPYVSTMRQASTLCRQAAERLLKLAKQGFLSGPYGQWADDSPCQVGLAVLPAALRATVQDANIVALARLADSLSATADDIDLALDSGWNGRCLPVLEADQDIGKPENE